MPVDARVNGLGSSGRGPVTSFGRWQASELEESEERTPGRSWHRNSR